MINDKKIKQEIEQWKQLKRNPIQLSGFRNWLGIDL